MKSQGLHIVNYAESRRKRRGFACLLWAVGVSLCLLIAGAVVSGAAYAGWNTGLATARANATTTLAAYARQQCDRLPHDLAAGSLGLAQSRFEDLANLPQTPACVPLWAPMATAAYHVYAASPTPPANSYAHPHRSATDNRANNDTDAVTACRGCFGSI